ncbi:MAG: hypothetical protein JXA42_06470 [Anaerolineales bacterium]|nr:hypothetical protein [Anaerolineales bacterium]
MFIIILLITIVGSILVNWLLPKAFKSQPPYGLVVDIGIGVIAAVIWVALGFYVIAPAINLRGWLLMVGTPMDAIGLAAVMLWVLRRIKG